jgi:hypothetical protein
MLSFMPNVAMLIVMALIYKFLLDTLDINAAVGTAVVAAEVVVMAGLAVDVSIGAGVK